MKAAALNEIPPEVWKTRQFDDILLWHCNEVYNQNPIDGGLKGCLRPLPKEGDLGLAKNYWDIALASIAAKIYNALLRNCTEPKIDNILSKNQNGFRRNRFTTSQILTIRRILEGVRPKKPTGKNIICRHYKGLWFLTQRENGANSNRVPSTKRNWRSHNDSLSKHQSERAFSRWRHRLLWHCSRGTARTHTCPISLYHYYRLRTLNIDQENKRKRFRAEKQKRQKVPCKNNYRRRLRWWPSDSGESTQPSQNPTA